MGNFTRRGSAAALLAAGAMVLTPLSALANDDSDPIDIDGPVDVEIEEGPDLWRFAGPDRVSTAIEAAERTNRDHWGDTVIIANTATFSDALAAAPLADAIDAPVLLNAPGHAVDARVMAYLDRAGFENVIVVGGTDVFGEAFIQQLEAEYYSTERYAGINRYQTALALAEAAMVEADWAGPQFNVFVADGTNFPDALAAGAAAANHNGVVVLSMGEGGLDSWTYSALTGINPGYAGPELWNHSALYTVGGPAAAGTARGWQGEPVEADGNIVGENRYETATLLATAFPGDGENFTIASGLNYPDAVVAGAYAGNVDGPLLLTKHDALPQVVVNFFEAAGQREQVENIFVFGGLNSVSRAVSQQLAAMDWDY